MQGYYFTERVRCVLAEARNEAAALGHPYIGGEHQLLALLSDDGVASTVLQSLGLDLRHTANAVRQRLVPGKHDAMELTDRELPYTTRAKKVLEYAMIEARDLNHPYVSTEHLLLALLREGKGIGAEVLHSSGVTVERVRAETLRVLGAVPTVPDV